MIELRGIIRDLLLVSVAALVAALVMQFSGQEKDSLQIQTEGAVVDLEESTSGDQRIAYGEQLAMLRMEMEQGFRTLNRKIEMLDGSASDEIVASDDIETVVDELTKKTSYADRINALVESEEYDKEASSQYFNEIDEHLNELALNSSLIDGVDCYASKCVMEIEHDTDSDEVIFRNLVLFNSKGPFSTRFTYKTEHGEGGGVYTKIILDR